jgi:hypothetical protein
MKKIRVIPINLFPYVILINADFGGVFQLPARASGFEMLNSFQASQNTTCWFPAKPFLEIDLIERA